MPSKDMGEGKYTSESSIEVAARKTHDTDNFLVTV
jgi:hypothetical protein